MFGFLRLLIVGLRGAQPNLRACGPEVLKLRGLVFTRPDAVQFLLDSWTHLRQHDGFQGNETTGRWSAMGCVPTLERGNDKVWFCYRT